MNMKYHIEFLNGSSHWSNLASDGKIILKLICVHLVLIKDQWPYCALRVLHYQFRKLLEV
jgi:hypothetical protein